MERIRLRRSADERILNCCVLFSAVNDSKSGPLRLIADTMQLFPPVFDSATINEKLNRDPGLIAFSTRKVTCHNIDDLEVVVYRELPFSIK